MQLQTDDTAKCIDYFGIPLKQSKACNKKDKIMGSLVSKVKFVTVDKKKLAELQSRATEIFPGSERCPSNRKNWMSELNPSNLVVREISGREPTTLLRTRLTSP